MLNKHIDVPGTCHGSALPDKTMKTGGFWITGQEDEDGVQRADVEELTVSDRGRVTS